MRRHISLMDKHIRTYNCTLISKLKELNDFLAHKAISLTPTLLCETAKAETALANAKVSA